MNKKKPILKIGYFAKLLNLSSQSDKDQKQVYAPKIISMVADRCRSYEYGYKKSPVVKIVRATLGNDAGIIGAAALFR